MRSIDRYRQCHKENVQSIKQEQNSTNWDFITSNNDHKPRFKITLDESGNENDIEKFERYIRQLGRCILSCSLCSRGTKMFKTRNDERIPHYQPSIWHKKVMFLKYEPNDRDIDQLFGEIDIKDILRKYGACLDDFYLTSIIKCAGKDETSCGYFDLEWKAIKPCKPQLIICFDNKSAEYIGAEYTPKSIQNINGQKIYCIGQNNDGLETIIKILVNPQTRNRLIS